MEKVVCQWGLEARAPTERDPLEVGTMVKLVVCQGSEARASIKIDRLQIETVVEEVVGHGGGLEACAFTEIDPLEFGGHISDRDGRHIFAETQIQIHRIRIRLLSSTDQTHPSSSLLLCFGEEKLGWVELGKKVQFLTPVRGFLYSLLSCNYFLHNHKHHI